MKAPTRWNLFARATSATIALALAALPAGAASSPAAVRIVEATIAAHGGMERWAGAPAVSFEDKFTPAGAEQGMVSRVSVEQGPRRATIDYPGTEMTLAWDGERAWSMNWTLPYPPRFMALLNYYFVNLPWLAMDPGVHLGEPGTATLPEDPTEYLTVKMTFDEGVGDTPDDYYLLYIHPDTHRLAATEYTVTYSALLPEGVESTEPNTLVYDAFEDVDGLTVPTHYTIYKGDGSVYGTCKFRDWSFSRPFDASRMTLPEGAVIDESTP